MSRPGENVVREALLVARYEITAMVLSVRAAMFVVVYAFAASVSGWVVLALNEKIKADPNSMNVDILGKLETLSVTERQTIIDSLSEKGLDGSTLELLISGSLPVIVVWILFTTTFILPGLVTLVGFTGIGDDLQSKFSRYVFQRVHRGSWLAGKMLAHFAVSIVGIVLVHTLLLAWATTIPELNVKAIATVLPMVWASMAILCLGYVSFTAVFAATVGPPFKALALSWFILGGLWFVCKFTPLDRVWIGSLDAQLWMLDPASIGIAIAQVAVFIGLAWYGLKRRDV